MRLGGPWARTSSKLARGVSRGRERRGLIGVGPRGPLDAFRAGSDAGRIDHRLGDTVDFQVSLDATIGECHRAERRQTERGGQQAEGLTEMSGLCQDRAVGTSVRISPLHAFEDRCHQQDRARLVVPRLAGQIVRDSARTATGDRSETMRVRVVMIEPAPKPLNFSRENIDLDTVPRSPRR